ncbi:MAG: hypothetical protein FDZ69_08665 [Deltaproteobacteria bacterium]|nr:MAG: hypothetical protein FDZ69_08665 [Deltaproteobacteria bacterium]
MNGSSRYAGMTVNERLLAAGLLAAFDRAARSRDRAEMLRLLRRVDVPAPEETVAAVLANPWRYGY